ncbi:MAG: hypothetical protein IT336_17020 [Thermomicrobiales bacterium]|nr:hypothetical protein [Thermomicrobiales bacterium]
MTMLRLALDGLPSEQRAAIQFATVERLTVDEIAGKIGRTVGDTRIAMRDGLSTLRDVLHALDPSRSAELGAVDVPSHR